jgi:Icc-related predicted phosphoesterase
MRIVILSDTHMRHEDIEVPDGDVLFHAGDFTNDGEVWSMSGALNWFRHLPHKRKICVAGNHDWVAERDPQYMLDTLGSDVDYLDGTGTELNGLYVWGSPIQPEAFDWAFNRSKLFRSTYWDKNLPAQTDILLTHCPPRGILDMNHRGEYLGDKHLRRNVDRVKPKLHIFGHIHEDRGAKDVDGTLFVNAAVLDVALQPTHKCWVFDYTSDGLVLVDH